MLTFVTVTLLLIIIILGIKLLKPVTHVQLKPENNIDKYKIAIHEAGHFIIAWSCSHVTEITKAQINDYDGFVTYYMINDGSNDNAWCELVIAIAGVAAEVKTYGKVASAPAKSDLEKALYLAHQLGNYVPKNIPDIKSLDFKSMFKNISDRECFLLSAAYRQAKEIIDNQKEKFYHVTVLLQNLKIIDESHVKQIMGTRAHITIIGLFAPLFVYPGFMKEAA